MIWRLKAFLNPESLGLVRKYSNNFSVAGHEIMIDGTPGIEFWGHTFLSDPFGVIVAEATDESEQIVYGEVDPSRIQEIRRHWPFLRDRRIDEYGDITKRFID